MAQLLHKLSIFFRKSKKQILYHRGVKSAGRGTSRNDFLCFKKDDPTILHGDDIVQSRAAVRRHIGFTEYLTNTDVANDIAVAPVIILLNMQCTFYQHHNIVNCFSLMENIFSILISAKLRIQASKHSRYILFSHSAEQTSLLQNWQIFFS